ncbi:MAG: radical SAM protein [Deltaproteobacteria bacterium]|nr:radical SAM protein [Deltaproteobacteria bacterium]
MIIPIFTPHGGCPERCRFCDQSVSGGDPVSHARVRATIEAHLATSPDGRAEEIAFYGGTFTAMTKERQLAYLSAAKPYLDGGLIGAVRVSTRPDALDRDWLARLRDGFRLRTVELGVQSVSATVLERLGRSHGVECIEPALDLLGELGLVAGLHFMVGCPGEAEDDDRRCLEFLARVRARVRYARLHPLLVLADTALENDFRAGLFAPIPLEIAVERCAALTEKIEALGIRVIRLGLQPNEILAESIVAGPFHPAFGDLVRGRILRNRVAGMLENRAKSAEGKGDRRRPPGLDVEVRVPEALLGRFKGPRAANLDWLKRRFNLSTLRVVVVQKAATHGHESNTENGGENRLQYECSGGAIGIRDVARPSERRQIELSQ